MTQNGKPAVGAAGGDGTERGGADTTGVNRQLYSSIERRNAQGPAHGRVEGRVWLKELRASRHFLRKPPAIAVDLADLEAAEQCGAELLLIEDSESGRQFLVSLAVIRAKGLKFDRGHGPQIGLGLKRWACFGAETRPYVQARLLGEVGA